MHTMKWLSALLLTFVLTNMAQAQSNMAQAQCSRQSLRIAIIPATNKPLDVLRHEYQPLLTRLNDALGIPVDLVSTSSSYESVIDAVVSGGVDIAWLGPASYIMAHQRDPRIEPFASLTINPGYFTPAGHDYRSLLLTRRGTATDITALRGKQLALSDPASTSGSVVPNVEFSAKIGQPLTQFFGAVVYAGSHEKSLEALLDGRVDAAFVASVEVDAYLRKGRINRDTFSVLWRSAPIYYSPYVFSGSLCPELKAQVRNAMLTDPQGLAAFLNAQDASGIVAASHAQYAPLQRMLQQSQKPAR